MKCFIDGTHLCIVNDDFVDLQESSGAVFIKLTEEQRQEIRKLFKQGIPDKIMEVKE